MDVRNFMRLFFFLQFFKTFIAHEPYRASHIRTTSFDTVVKDWALQNHVIEVVHEYSPLDCGFACLQTTNCQSYNIRQETTDLYECELSSSTKTQHPNDFKSVSGVTYYGSDTFHGLGCAAANCPNKNCKETKSYPFYHCQDDAFDLKFPSNATNHTVTEKMSTSSNQVSICFWCKTSGHSPFVSYKNNGNPASTLDLLYSADGFVVFQINNVITYEATIPPIHDDKWHHMCTTWNSSSGHVNIYVDGTLRTYPTGTSYFKDEKIVFNGTFTIGHFNNSHVDFSYTGKLSQLNIWDYVMPSNEIKAIAKSCTMSHIAGGNVVKWGRDFAPTPEDSADPRDCSERDMLIKSVDSDLHFPGTNTVYSSQKQMPTLNTFTISWWLKTSWIPTADSQLMAIASFVLVSEPQKHLLVAIRGTFEIHFEIAGEQSFHKLPPINDDRWHHMAITWENVGGRWDFFLDGVHRSSIDEFQSGHEVPASVLIIGQNGDRHDSAYSSDDELQGSLSRFNIWDKRLSVELIVALAKDPGHDEGNVNSWRNLQSLKSYVNRTEPSTVVSSAGKSNVAFTFIHWTKHNYARIPYSGAEIGQLTVCTWLDLSYTDEYQPTLLSYSSTTTNDFYISFNSDNLKGIVMAVHVQPYGLGDDSALNNKLWRHLCVRWNGDLGEVNWYLEGVEQNSRTDLPKKQTLASPGIWVFTNEQDSHGGGFSGRQSFKKSLAQINVWNYVLPVQAMKALAYGGTSVEGNLFRWSDIVANYNPGGYFVASSFKLYMPDGVVQKKRDEYCNQISSTCLAAGTLYARIGPRKNFHPPGIQWRCYCKDNVGPDKSVKVVSHYYSTKETELLAIV